MCSETWSFSFGLTHSWVKEKLRLKLTYLKCVFVHFNEKIKPFFKGTDTKPLERTVFIWLLMSELHITVHTLQWISLSDGYCVLWARIMLPENDSVWYQIFPLAPTTKPFRLSSSFPSASKNRTQFPEHSKVSVKFFEAIEVSSLTFYCPST